MLKVPLFFPFVSSALSWRDVQHIIAWTARQDPVAIMKSSWTVNKANLSG